MIDRYTKVTLTVIALSLVLIAGEGLMPRAVTTKGADGLTVDVRP